MPVPTLTMDKDKIKYVVPVQTRMYICNHCKNETASLRWIEKFRNEKFKCDNCWQQAGV